MNIPRSEHPRPIFMRKTWQSLNGTWQFEIDNACCGTDKKFFERKNLEREITVPFCPESRLSGIGNTDFMLCVWYAKEFEIPAEYKDKNVILHFGAVDYRATVYVNGRYVGKHSGGYTPFSFDITEYIKESGNYISLCAYDDIRSHNQPAGKQSPFFESQGCFYTRTTGIWQTVWLEYVNPAHIKSIKTTTDIETPAANITLNVSDAALGSTVRAEAFWNGRPVGSAHTVAHLPSVTLNITLSEKHLWGVGKGNLYDLKLTVEKDGNVSDTVFSYFGLRSVCLDGRAFKINGKTVFGRFVLDQGFYPDGIYTAPSVEEMKKDIEYSMSLGFNGARMHEKVFEPYYIYLADKMGYLVWEEYANWSLDISDMGQIRRFLPEWLEAVERDFSNPSVIGLCPFNETWDFDGKCRCNALLETVYRTTKLLDPTRPVIDTSGHYHVATDIWDVHDYESDPSLFKSYYENIADGTVKDQIYRISPERQRYDGKMPVFVSEYGGIGFALDDESWGYGDAPKTEEEFIARYKGLTDALLDNKYIMGFCYTQLYDVEQEKNGLLTYDRVFKFNPEIFKKINSRRAAIEEENE